MNDPGDDREEIRKRFTERPLRFGIFSLRGLVFERVWNPPVGGILSLKPQKAGGGFDNRTRNTEESRMTEKFRSGHATHVGNVRDHNEDSYLVRPDLGLWIVADGMGGHESGEVASAMTVEVVNQLVQAGKSLKESLVSAHRAVMGAADSDPRKTGMGSTVVVLRVTGNRYEIAWVGDSRVYLWSLKHGFKQLTHDHSYVQLLVDNELIRPEEARYHPMSHVVNQAIGSSPDGSVTVDTREGVLEPGDRFLLCTDGLTNEVPDAGIAEVLQHEKDHQAAVDMLIDEALAAGGADNVTVVLVEIPG